MPSLEAAAVAINITGVWLTARRNMMCWPVGMVGVILYLRQFYLWHLYGDMLLQAIYCIILGYGWYSWRTPKKAPKKQNHFHSLIPRNLRTQVVLTACIGLPVGWGFSHFTNDPQPYIDSVLMCLSLLASLWTTRKYMENWYLWIFVDFIYAWLFLYRTDFLTASLYTVFSLLAMYGVFTWKRDINTH
ncbi:nicotinamide mononucleotide transporter [Acetobacter sp. DmW_136]|uniref:nicotinamide riboside transporter PnuC n=1 Tax=Acetobacter sp. DmW_136 TaxID=2591091 RepID=UPI00123B98D1|nr:nicotinamide riboside transporter PnuC [Acetobacter sp. DmW_136]KAA8383508.1 nicotinamide mononucleotide transporter [Acetobacter sp. DmW_136]